MAHGRAFLVRAVANGSRKVLLVAMSEDDGVITVDARRMRDARRNAAKTPSLSRHVRDPLEPRPLPTQAPLEPSRYDRKMADFLSSYAWHTHPTNAVRLWHKARVFCRAALCGKHWRRTTFCANLRKVTASLLRPWPHL